MKALAILLTAALLSPATPTIEYVFPAPCVVRDETGRPKIDITEDFSCRGVDIKHLTCTGFKIVLNTDCGELHLLKP